LGAKLAKIKCWGVNRSQLYPFLASINDVLIGCGFLIEGDFLVDLSGLPEESVRFDGRVTIVWLYFCVSKVLVGCPSSCLVKEASDIPFTNVG
jgi:hypothetical protein